MVLQGCEHNELGDTYPMADSGEETGTRPSVVDDIIFGVGPVSCKLSIFNDKD